MRLEWRRGIALACAAVALALAVSAAPATARDSVYRYSLEERRISRANLDGKQFEDFDVPGGIPSNVKGIAIDAAGGRIYWNLGDAIEFANLDGSGRGTLNTTGAVLNDAISLAIDTVSRRVYWANSNPAAPTIGFANLDGSGGGNVAITGATRPAAPLSLLVHPGGGRIYWADQAGNRISFARLDGSGGADLDTTGAPLVNPVGLVIDAGSQRIYWGSAGVRAFGSASLAGGVGTELPLLGTSKLPFGVALDVADGRLYWSGSNGANAIGSVPFPAGGTNTEVASGSAGSVGAFNPILLKAPVDRFPARPPVLPIAPQGSRLTCPDFWAGDLVEANLMQAPQTVTYRWTRADKFSSGDPGAEIPGANGREIVATEPGTYSCKSTATNFAGSTTSSFLTAEVFPVPAQKKPPAGKRAAMLALLKTTLNRRKGTATLRLMVSGAGKLEVRGRKLAPVDRTTGRNDSVVKVTLRPRGKAAQRLLARKGSLKTTARVTFSADGETRSLSARVVLKKIQRRR
jgi:hypothetical protein